MTEVAGVVYDTFADKATYSPFVYKSFGSPMYNRVGKTGSLRPWSRVIVYCSKLSFHQNYSPIGGSFWQNDSQTACYNTL